MTSHLATNFDIMVANFCIMVANFDTVAANFCIVAANFDIITANFCIVAANFYIVKNYKTQFQVKSLKCLKYDESIKAPACEVRKSLYRCKTYKIKY